MAVKSAGLPSSDLAAARAAADRFMQAVKKGDEAAVRSMIIIREGESIDFKSMHESTPDYALSEAKIDGAFVVVEATVKGPQAPPMPLPIMLTRAQGSWKIDMGESIKRMMGGVDLEAMMKDMATGIGNAMSEGLGAVAEGLSTAMSGEAPAVAANPAKKAAKKPAPKAKAKAKKKGK